MEKMKKHASNIMSGMAKQMMKADAREWPPGCMVFLYQPVRPQQKLKFGAEEQNDRKRQR